MFNRIKIDKADKMFSDYIRFRDNWKCVRCGRVHLLFKNTLDNSHYFSRGKESVRFDEENCDSLCKFPCHPVWEKEEREAYKAFKVKQLGQKGFDALTLRAHTPGRRDRKMAYLYWKKRLEELLNKEEVV